MNLDEQKYSILYLEDDDRDQRINKFRELAEQAGFDNIQIIGDPFQFKNMSKRIGKNKTKYDVIICDIEIWQQSKNDDVSLLTALGFSYIEDMINNGNDYIYIILSNTPTSFFSKITTHIHRIKDVRQKDKVFQSVDSINNFIEELKQYINEKKQKLIETTPTTISIFEQYNNYIHQKANYPLTIILKEGSATHCNNYSDIEDIIDIQLNWLISEWTKILENTAKSRVNMEMNTIASQLKLGGEFRRKNILYKSNEINNFVRKLILRRFVIYVSTKSNISLKQACLTVSGQERSFDNILLFSNTADTYSDEEKAYKNKLKLSE